MRFRTTPLLAIAAAGLVGLASVHCGASAFEPGILLQDAAPGADAGGADRSADAGGGDAEATGQNTLNDGGAEAAPPTVEPKAPIESNLLVLANASSLPAFRLCPATSATGPIQSDSPKRPMPEVLMPGSSLEGVPERGAVGVLPDATFAGVSSVVVLWIDDVTKNHPGLAAGACSALACVGRPGCLDDGVGLDRHVTVVKLTNPAFDKKGIVVLGGASKATATFSTRTTAQSFNAKAGTLDVQLFDEVKSGARVSFQAPDGGSTPIVSQATVEYDGFGGAFAAGNHRETLLEVHANSAPRRPIVDFYATPGLFALFLLGTPADPRFVVVPTHR